LPNNSIVVSHAADLFFLKHTSVCVTHAGLYTVLDALAK
jgi:UDP:flavonoid glycosyltransferase YjiC (YdhE family)